MFATRKWSAEKLNHAASILAELLDNDNDGCADDPKVLSKLLNFKDEGKRAACLLPNKESHGQSAERLLAAAGINN